MNTSGDASGHLDSTLFGLDCLMAQKLNKSGEKKLTKGDYERYKAIAAIAISDLTGGAFEQNNELIERVLDKLEKIRNTKAEKFAWFGVGYHAGFSLKDLKNYVRDHNTTTSKTSKTAAAILKTKDQKQDQKYKDTMDEITPYIPKNPTGTAIGTPDWEKEDKGKLEKKVKERLVKEQAVKSPDYHIHSEAFQNVQTLHPDEQEIIYRSVKSQTRLHGDPVYTSLLHKTKELFDEFRPFMNPNWGGLNLEDVAKALTSIIDERPGPPSASQWLEKINKANKDTWLRTEDLEIHQRLFKDELVKRNKPSGSSSLASSKALSSAGSKTPSSASGTAPYVVPLDQAIEELQVDLQHKGSIKENTNILLKAGMPSTFLTNVLPVLTNMDSTTMGRVCEAAKMLAKQATSGDDFATFLKELAFMKDSRGFERGESAWNLRDPLCRVTSVLISTNVVNNQRGSRRKLTLTESFNLLSRLPEETLHSLVGQKQPAVMKAVKRS